jgi:hypothetical protein
MRKQKQHSRRIASLVKQYGEPMFKSVFDVYGVNANGNGKVNPDAHVQITMFGVDFKDCKSKLNDETDGAFFKPAEIIDLNPAYSRAYEDHQNALKAVEKAFVDKLRSEVEVVS